MNAVFLLVFAVFTVLTWRAFTLKMRKVEPLPRKMATCGAVAVWSLWLALIATASVFVDTGEVSTDSVATGTWLLLALANIAISAYAFLSRLALQCSRHKEEKEGDGVSPHDS